MNDNSTSPPGATGDLPHADGSRPRGLVDHVLLAAVVSWLALAVFLLVWKDRPQAGPSDSLAHVVLFAGLSFTVQSFVSTRATSTCVLWASTAGILVFAAASEVVQAAFVTQRSGSFSDLAADALGVGLGVLLGASLRLLPPKGARLTAAVASTLAVSLIAGFVVVSSVGESAWWRCRGSDGDPIENSLTDLANGPMLEFDGTGQQWRGGNGEQSTGSRSPDRAASAAWCAAISSEELTLVLVVDSGASTRSPLVEIFGTTNALDGTTPNLTVDARQYLQRHLLTIRARHRFRAPRIYNVNVDGVFGGEGQQWIAVRYEDGEMTIDVDARRVFAGEVEFEFRAWDTGIPMDVGDAGVSGDGPVTYAGFFGRRLSDQELTKAIDGLLG